MSRCSLRKRSRSRQAHMSRAGVHCAGIGHRLTLHLRAQERRMELQWEADRRLARQVANEERRDQKKNEKVAAQVPSHASVLGRGHVS